MNKKCPKCEEKTVQKWGKKYGLQNYKCKNCKHSFTSKKRNQMSQKKA